MKLLSCCLLVCLLLVSTSSFAEQLHVKVHDPVWQVLLNNTAIAQRTVALQPNEISFGRQLQPLLQQKNYTAIAELFTQRDLANDSAALQILRGQVMLQLQRYADASLALESAIKQQPDLALAHQALSMVFMQQQQYKKARPHLVKAINLGVADAQVYGQLAFINLQTGQAASAIAGYQQALLLEPDNQQWQQGVLYSLMQSQSWSQAQAMLEQLIQQQPDNATLWLQRGQLALNQDKPQQAISSIEVALRLGNNDAENLVLAAQLHLAYGSAERGVSLLQQAMQQNKVDSAWHDTLVYAADWLSYQQQWTSLRRLMSKISPFLAQLRPQQQAKLALVQAELANADKKPQQALIALKQAVALDPLSGKALLELGKWYQQHGNLDLATMHYSRAARIPEVKVTALQAQAQLDIDRQQYQSALQLLQQVQQLAPEQHGVHANIRSLQQLARQQG